MVSWMNVGCTSYFIFLVFYVMLSTLLTKSDGKLVGQRELVYTGGQGSVL